MSEPTGCAGGCLHTDTYCGRCNLLVGLPGFHVVEFVPDVGRLTVSVESPASRGGLSNLRRDRR